MIQIAKLFYDFDVDTIHLAIALFKISIIVSKIHLSYDVAVFQWITSCHKNRMTTHVITLLREYVTSLTTSVTSM